MTEIDPRLRRQLDDMYDRGERQALPTRLASVRAAGLQRTRRWPQVLLATATVAAVAAGAWAALLVHRSAATSTAASGASLRTHPLPRVTMPTRTLAPFATDASPSPVPTPGDGLLSGTADLTYGGALSGAMTNVVVTCERPNDVPPGGEQGGVINVMGDVGGVSRLIEFGFDADGTTWHVYEGPTARMAGNQPTTTADYADDAYYNAGDFAALRVAEGGFVSLQLTDLRGAGLAPAVVKGTISCG